jgi:hypothetical protein
MTWRHTGDIWRWGVNFIFRPFYLRRRTLVPIVYKTVRASELFRRRDWVLAPAGVRIQDHPDSMLVTVYATQSTINMSIVKGKDQPLTRLCRHKWEADLQLRQLRNLQFRRGWVVNSTPRPLNPGKDSALIMQETGWTSGSLWAGYGNSRPHLYSIPGPSSRLRYSGRPQCFTFRYCFRTQRIRLKKCRWLGHYTRENE